MVTVGLTLHASRIVSSGTGPNCRLPSRRDAIHSLGPLVDDAQLYATQKGLSSLE
jgi:hypothetical protein